MSNHLRTYTTPGEDGMNHRLEVGAFVGGDQYGMGIQFTMGNRYVCLSQEQVADLIGVLAKRLACAPGYSATDTVPDSVIYPHRGEDQKPPELVQVPDHVYQRLKASREELKEILHRLDPDSVGWVRGGVLALVEEHLERQEDEAEEPEPKGMPSVPKRCACGERLDTDEANVRWNGEAWEHRSHDVHPQAGYHLVDDDPLRGHDPEAGIHEYEEEGGEGERLLGAIDDAIRYFEMENRALHGFALHPSDLKLLSRHLLRKSLPGASKAEVEKVGPLERYKGYKVEDDPRVPPGKVSPTVRMPWPNFNQEEP